VNNKSGVYKTKAGYWVLLKSGGRGAEDQWQPSTNDFDFFFSYIFDNFRWSKDKKAQQEKLDSLALGLGLEEVPLYEVKETYRNWEYVCA